MSLSKELQHQEKYRKYQITKWEELGEKQKDLVVELFVNEFLDEKEFQEISLRIDIDTAHRINKIHDKVDNYIKKLKKE